MNPIRPTKPMKEGRIYLDSLIFGSFWLDPTMRWKFWLNLGLRWWFLFRSLGCHTDLTKNEQIRRRSSKDSAKIWLLKLTLTSTNPTIIHRRLIRLNSRLSTVGGESFNLPPDVRGLVSGWAQTQPKPTCEHPYLALSKMLPCHSSKYL